MNIRKKFVVISAAVLCVFLLVWLIVKSNQKPGHHGQLAGGETAEPGVSAEGLLSEPVIGSDGRQPEGGVSGERVFSQESAPDPLVQELQDLLDDDASREQTLAKAIALSKDTVQRQAAAINALRWIGGREAAKALIRLRKEGYPEIADEAGRVLTHLLTEGLYSGRTPSGSPDDAGSGDQEQDSQPETDEKEELDWPEAIPFDAAIWEQAILEAPMDADREELLILLSAFPATQSVPVLLNLLESDNQQIREHALEYLEFVTYGEKITTRQEGEDWLAKNGAMEEFVP